MVRGAGSSDPAVRHAALERLCAQYWYPLYTYQRRRGREPDEAADSVQDLFAHLLDGDRFASLDEGGGRFRNWLLTVLQNHERDRRDRDRAHKRGGGVARIPIDGAEGERRLQLHGDATGDPQVAFERAWAHETLRMARDLLQQEMAGHGKAPLFDALAPLLDQQAAPPHAEIAQRLGIRAVTLRVTLHRMRTRYRELLVAVVAESLGERTEAGAELEALAAALAGKSGVRS